MLSQSSNSLFEDADIFFKVGNDKGVYCGGVKFFTFWSLAFSHLLPEFEVIVGQYTCHDHRFKAIGSEDDHTDDVVSVGEEERAKHCHEHPYKE